MYDPEYIAYKQKAARRYGLGVHQSHFVEGWRVAVLLVAFVIGVALGMVLYATSEARAQQGHPGCVPSDLAGSWQVMQYAGVYGHQQCGLRVRADGTVEPNATICRNWNQVESRITGGKLTIRPTCRVEGEASNEFGTFRITWGWMDLSKNSITVAGADDTGLPQFMHIIRRPW